MIDLIITIGAYGFLILMGLFGLLTLLVFTELLLEALIRNPFGDTILKWFLILIAAVLVTTVVLTSLLYIPGVITTKIACWLFLYIKPLIGSLFFIAIADCGLLFILANITQPLMKKAVYSYLEKDKKFYCRFIEEEAENRSWDVHIWALIASVLIMFSTITLMCTSVIALDTALPNIL